MTFFRDFYDEYFDDPLRHLRFTQTVRSLVGEATALSVLGEAFVEMHERAAAASGKPRWADKSPDNVLHLAGWQQLLGNAWHFVLVVRNPVDTLGSMNDAGFPLSLPPDLDGRARHLKRYLDAGLDFVEAQPQRATVLVYEELTAAPEKSLAALMRSLGETSEPGQLDFQSSSHQPGLEDPKIARTRAVEPRRPGVWRATFSGQEIREIEKGTESSRDRLRALLGRELPGWGAG